MVATKFRARHYKKSTSRRKKSNRGRKNVILTGNVKFIDKGKNDVHSIRTDFDRHVKVNKLVQTDLSCLKDTGYKISASKRKLDLYAKMEASGSSDHNLTNPQNNNSEYILMNVGNLKSLFSGFLCDKCKKNSLELQTGNNLGYAVKVKVYCNNCNSDRNSVASSPQLDYTNNHTRNPYEINKRAVFAMKSVGLGCESLNRITKVMGISGGMHHKTYSTINRELHSCLVNTTCPSILLDAHELVRAAYSDVDNNSLHDEIHNIMVSYDGSWQKRGHTSLYGCAFVIDVITGFVLDYHVLSRYCFECEMVGSKLTAKEREIWSQAHSADCQKNYDGSSNSMESAIADILWSRSTNIGFRYTTMLSDGDTSTFENVKSKNYYGSEYPIEKEECVNHISKRMFNGLDRIAKDALAGAKAEKGVKRTRNPILGKGKMTRERMMKWSQYYRNAIMSNSTVPDMKDAIWAIFFHSVSEPADPHHDRCGDWCYAVQAKASGKSPQEIFDLHQHDPPLPRDIAEHFLPLFKRLTNDSLLERCTRNLTQNANECLHSVIWRHVPKTIFTSLKTLETGISLAVGEFNKGKSTLSNVFESMNITPGNAFEKYVKSCDTRRIKKAEHAASLRTKAARVEKKRQKASKEDKLEEIEGETYGPGLDTTKHL